MRAAIAQIDTCPSSARSRGDYRLRLIVADGSLQYMESVLGLLFTPISTMSYVGVPISKNNDVAGMTNLARNVGGSCGTALFTTMLLRHAQSHQDVLVKHAVHSNIFFSNQLKALTQQHGAHQALAQIYQRVQQQASLLSYLDIILFFGVACLCMTPVAFLMKKAAKGGEVVMH